MKKLLSLFLACILLLGILPTSVFAADSVEEALGEVNIYNGDYELGYLSINGAVKKQTYTYFLYESNDGTTKESPAYCVNPTTPGVPQSVGPGESIKYLAEEKASDPKVVGIISNGYPHRSLGELNLDNKYQAYGQHRKDGSKRTRRAGQIGWPSHSQNGWDWKAGWETACKSVSGPTGPPCGGGGSQAGTDSKGRKGGPCDRQTGRTGGKPRTTRCDHGS